MEFGEQGKFKNTGIWNTAVNLGCSIPRSPKRGWRMAKMKAFREPECGKQMNPEFNIFGKNTNAGESRFVHE